jgi:uncharacterized membrane protein
VPVRLPPLAPRKQPHFPWARVDPLIDAVYAIAATLLVLDLRPPVAEPGHLGHALLSQGPKYLVYAMGFLQIIAGWSVLRRIGATCTGLDAYASLLLFCSMLTYTVTPFTLAVMSDATGNRDDFTSAVRLMAVVLLFSMLGFTGLVAYLDRYGLFRTDVDPGLFGLARLIALTAWVWPLATLLLSYVVGPWALTPTVLLFALSLAPLDLLTSEQYATTSEAIELRP